MDIAQKIGTYETSILPYEDCCTVFTPRHPVTRPKLSTMPDAERKLDVEALVDEAVEATEMVIRLTEPEMRSSRLFNEGRSDRSWNTLRS